MGRRKKITFGTGGGIMPPVESMIKAARISEEAGYSGLWWPDHLMGWTPESIWSPDISNIAVSQKSPHVYFDVVAAMAAVAVSTNTITLGTSVTEPIRRHPAMLAQEFLSLDHISKGRVILGIGAGEGENIIPYGLDYSNQASKLEEALRIIRLLWSTDQPVDFDGRFWTLRQAVLGLRPYGPKPPPIWVAAMGPRMLEICGRYADGWLPMAMAPEEYGEKLRAIHGAAVKHGRALDAFTAGMFAYVVVAEDHETCHRIIEHPIVKNFALAASHDLFRKYGAEHPLGSGFYGMKEYIPNRLSREQALDAIGRIPPAVAQDYIVHGTPDELCDQIEAYGEQGLQHMAMANVGFMSDVGLVRSSFAALARVVREFD